MSLGFSGGRLAMIEADFLKEQIADLEASEESDSWQLIFAWMLHACSNESQGMEHDAASVQPGKLGRLDCCIATSWVRLYLAPEECGVLRQEPLHSWDWNAAVTF